MTDIAIMTDVPMPKPIAGGRKRKYPFDKIAVGGMFFLPGRDENNFATYAGVWGRRLNRTFRTRLCYMKGDDATGWTPCEETDKGATQGIGVWRVE